jgi:polyisoprenoid-binding protein YceI
MRIDWALAALGMTFAAMSSWSTAIGAQVESSMFEVHGGTASFEVGTNVPALAVHGTSKNLDVSAHVREEASAITLTAIEATLPIASLTTGLGLRDEHMRRYVFTTPDGRMPDLRFVGARGDCVSQSKQTTCSVSGELTVRGTARPAVFTMKISPGGTAWRAVGETTIKLSDYEIPLPSQLGVRTRDEVQVHVDFVAKRTLSAAGPRAGGGE